MGKLLYKVSIFYCRGEWGKKSRGLKVSMAVVQNLEVLHHRQLVFSVLWLWTFYYEKLKGKIWSRFLSVIVWRKSQLLTWVWAHHRNIFSGMNLKVILMFHVINLLFGTVTLLSEEKNYLKIHFIHIQFYLESHGWGK